MSAHAVSSNDSRSNPAGRAAGLQMGFSVVESGPLVRSSYHARAALGDAARGGADAAPL